MTPDTVQITVNGAVTPPQYICHLRPQPQHVDTYQLDFEASFTDPFPDLKRYHFEVQGVMGLTEAINLCMAYFERLSGFQAALQMGCYYVP